MSNNLRGYQVVLLGPNLESKRRSVLDTLKQRLQDLGTGIWERLGVLEGPDGASFDNSAPVIAVWFGSAMPNDPVHVSILDRLIAEAKTVIPTVEDISRYKSQTPAQLHPINGLALDPSSAAVGRVVNTILEALQLLRRRRRLFISYARNDSRAVAKQLFETFSEAGFDVFLDTHSVPAATEFQLHLWHSLVDSDLVLLLDTNGIEDSRWCRAEFERADALSVGVVRAVWPNRKINPTTDALLLSLFVQLRDNDFKSSSSSPGPADELVQAAIERVTEAVEGFRARSIAARQVRLITTFQREATSLGITADVQMNSHIILTKTDSTGRLKKTAVIPTVGVPISTNYHDAFIEYNLDPPSTDEQVVLYDRQGFLPTWVSHLTWLHGSLPIKGIDMSLLLLLMHCACE